MTPLVERLQRELDERAAGFRKRELRLPEGIDCSSNDYLGLSDHPGILHALHRAAARGVQHGSTGSRLLSGNHPEHLDAEALFASFIGREAAILFGSGFAANLAFLSTIPSRRDLILLDSLAHASLKEGARASLATKRTFRHNDLADLERGLRDRDSFGDLFIVVEGIYSMDGDRGDLRGVAGIAERHGGYLIVDEAHSTGLYGDRLRGMQEAAGITPLASIHPCGKALGSSGAFVAADRVVIEYLINNARPFLFSTAPSPLQAVALAEAVKLLPSMRERAGELMARASRLRKRLDALARWSVIPSDSPIIPVITGDDASAVRAAAMISARGFDVRPIRPPTVPQGTSRLRISLTWKISDKEIDRLGDVIVETEEEMNDE